MNEPHLRLFLALWPDAQLRRSLHAAAREAIRESGGRPVPAMNYHLTLAFLGDQPRTQLAVIDKALSRMPPLAGTLRLERFGHFRGARVLWAGPLRTPPGLRRDANRMCAALTAQGLDFTPAPFRAHITLARRIVRVPRAPLTPLRWNYAGVVLVQSEGGRAAYRVLKRWPEPDAAAME